MASGTDRKTLGAAGEAAAAAHLQGKGWRILARNFRIRSAEIDIVADDRGTVVFVEVKTRSSTRFGTPGQAVNRRKQEKIIRAAQIFLRQERLEGCPCRFDVVEVYVHPGGTLSIRHLPGAFELQ